MNPESAEPKIQVEPSAQAGTESVLTVVDFAGRPSPGVTVYATQRPGLPNSEETALGITDSLGRVRWTPEQGGVVALRAGEIVSRVAVDWAAPPADTSTLLGLLILFGLGSILFGAGRRRLPRAPETR